MPCKTWLLRWLSQLNVLSALNNRLCWALHHSRFYTGMADPVPGNSGITKCPGFPGIEKPGMDTLVATLPCEMQTFDNDTNCAQLRQQVTTLPNFHTPVIDSVEFVQNIVFNLHTISQTRVPLVPFLHELFICQQDSALTHRARNTGFRNRQHHSSYHQNKQPRY